MKKLLLALLFLISPAWGQQAVQQTGPVTPFDAMAWAADHIAQGAANLFSIQGRGFNPFHVLDSNSCGIYLETAPTTGAYAQACLGHDASNNFIIDLSSKNGAAAGGLLARVNGVLTQLIGGSVTPFPVNTNTALKAVITTNLSAGVPITRLGFTVLGDAPALVFILQTGNCNTNSLLNDGGACVDSNDGNSWKSTQKYGWDVRQWGVSYPYTMYVATTGNDNSGRNTCLIQTAPCLTLQQTANQIPNFQNDGSKATISLAAGTYSNGVVFGAQSPPQYVVLNGAGSASTILNVTACGAPHALVVQRGWNLEFGGIKLTTTCSAGTDLLVSDNARAISNADVNFGAALGALVDVVNHSNYTALNGITISGGAPNAFLISTISSVVTGVNVTNTITGTPAFPSGFVDAIDGSFFNMGTASSWSGSATGPRYSLALNSFIDTEQITTPLPGNAIGNVQMGSIYYDYGTLACPGGGGGCRIATSPTGLGTGSSMGVSAGSGDQSGQFSFTIGTGAASTGIAHIATPSAVFGPQGRGGFCSVTFNHAGTAWANGATVQCTYSSSTGDLAVLWSNNGSALANGATYNINYMIY